MTIKSWALAALLLISFTACKKNNPTPDPKPDPIGIENLTITQLKALSTASSVTISKEKTLYKIKGVVISDNSATGKNIDAKTAIIAQADNAIGIVVNFATAHSFAVGTEVQIGVSNQKLIQQNGEIVLDAIPLDSAKTIGGQVVNISPRQTTIANILDNKAAWNGTLVKIAATELTGGDSKFTGILKIKDASGEMTTQVQSSASFAGKALPASVSSVTGIVRISGNETRVDLRKVDDVIAGEVSRWLIDDFSKSGLIGGSQDFTGYGWTYHLERFAKDDFLNNNRKYIYLLSSRAYILASSYNELKTVRVTFSGSKETGSTVIEIPDYGSDTIDLPAFNTNTDTYGIAIFFRSVNAGEYPIAVASYKDLGVSHTLSVDIPRNIEGIKEALVKANYTGDVQAAADDILHSMTVAGGGSSIGVKNISTATASRWQLTTPIIIEKTEYGFTK